MEVLIRRDDAIKALSEAFGECEPCDKEEAIDIAVTTVKEVPSADRPQGEWEDTGKDPDHSHPLTAIWYKCSECGDGTNAKTNYCPNCGAKMK